MAYKKTTNPFYKGNEYLPKAGIRKELTPFELEEIAKCMEDPVYFAEAYFKVVDQDADDGVVPMKLYPYQREAIENVVKTRRLLMATARQIGKALNIKEKIPLAAGGFKLLGQLEVGDLIVGSNGLPTKVIYKSEIFDKPSYRVTFEDGNSIDVCEDHLWTVTNRINHRKIETKNTKRLAQDFRKLNARGYYEYRYTVPNVQPVQYSAKQQLVDPYTLGIWLGDGSKHCSTFACHIDDKQHYLSEGIKFTSEFSYERTRRPSIFVSSIKNLRPGLRQIGVLNNKHIPANYLYGSVEQRLALLQGLMDTDGHVRKNGTCEIQLTDKVPQLIKDVNQLLCSLGIKVFVSHFDNNNFREPTSSTRMYFTPPVGMQIARMPRKAARLKDSRPFQSYTNSRSIVNIEQIANIPTQCIQVDAHDHLFAVTDKYILTHNTTVATVIILWVALFNRNKNIALLADKQETATEVLDRIKLAYEYLPDFLKGGVKKWDAKTVIFENSSKIMAAATGSNTVRGKSLYLLYIDEAAHVDDWENFNAAVMPTVNKAKSSYIILTSTPNGMNHFYDYYLAAKNKVSEYHLVEVPWWKVEGRDEAWKQKTLADMNFNQQKFDQEQCVEFLGSSGTLISGATLKILEEKTRTLTAMVTDNGLSLYSHAMKAHQYVLIADVSRGKLLDYSAFHVIDVTTTPYRQVCTYYNNAISAPDYAAVIDRIARHYNMAHVLIENNDNGGAVLDVLFLIYEYENILMTESSGVGQKQISFSGERGVRTSKPIKAVGCSMIKALVEQQQLDIVDRNTVNELKTFSSKGVSYEAEEGKHDDLVMGLVLFGWLSKQDYFRNITDSDVMERLRESTEDDVDDYMMGFGIVISNGLEQPDVSFETGLEIPHDKFNDWMNW